MNKGTDGLLGVTWKSKRAGSRELEIGERVVVDTSNEVCGGEI